MFFGFLSLGSIGFCVVGLFRVFKRFLCLVNFIERIGVFLKFDYKIFGGFLFGFLRGGSVLGDRVYKMLK